MEYFQFLKRRPFNTTRRIVLDDLSIALNFFPAMAKLNTWFSFNNLVLLSFLAAHRFSWVTMGLLLLFPHGLSTRKYAHI